MKKILLALDSFKGTMIFAEVCGELAAAIRGIHPRAEVGVRQKDCHVSGRQCHQRRSAVPQS